jgi:hypothetical protein
MTKVNIDNSQNDVITTVSHVLMGFEDMVLKEMPNIPVVYTEELSFEEGLKKLLAESSYAGNPTENIVPFLAYNRTVLRRTEDRHAGVRASNKTGCIRVGDDAVQYGMTASEFDVQFIYAANNIELSEKFEVVYNSEEGISGTKELVVDLLELGEFKYFMDFKELIEKNIAHEDTYYKLIIGSVTIRGFYFTFRSQSGIIKEINQRIISSRNLAETDEDEILSDIQII